MNSVIEIAKKHQRNYITPEDVTDTLEILAGVSGYGAGRRMSKKSRNDGMTEIVNGYISS